jgi:quercetin dioxygenase-like cupin family protein
MDSAEFRRQLEQEGFSSIVTVEREANGALDEHTHPFEAKALVLDGEILLRCGDSEQLCRVGDIFHLQAGEPHHESYGPQGVRYLVGRK